MPQEDELHVILQEQQEQPTKKRRELLLELENELKASVVTYMANFNHPINAIMKEDMAAIMDLVKVASEKSKKVYLILESLGGDGSAAEKIIATFREIFNEGFNVIIPNQAKSAATMIALGADKIIMGIPSELGPIDPQIQILGPTGNYYVPAKIYLGALDEIRSKIKDDASSLPIYYPILSQIKPEVIKYCQEAVQFSEDFAKRWLPKGIMNGKRKEDIEKTTKELIKGERYRLHDSFINYKEAKEDLNLNVEFWGISDKKWRLVWQYYLRTKIEFQNPIVAKLLETRETSTRINVMIQKAV